MWLAGHLLATAQQKQTEIGRLQALFQQHPDHELFAALPGAADSRSVAPALLAKFGDDRERFPEPGSLQSMAGTCPVTEKSGKSRRISFRQACDHEFRDIAQQWAKSSIAQSSWAATYWHQVREHSRSANHAYRCLANRWLATLAPRLRAAQVQVLRGSAGKRASRMMRACTYKTALGDSPPVRN